MDGRSGTGGILAEEASRPPAQPPAGWPGDPSAADIEAGARWRALGLSDDEWRRIRDELGRPPTWTELGMFSVAWSEHCAYKHSRDALRRLPASGANLLMGPGESAGVLDIGGGWAVAVRLESHNHPSYVEPYQGAATGVGGIVRDVLAAGARPVALLNSLRFGPPGEQDGVGGRRNRYLFREVVAGIAGYGNAIGVPTVGGEVAFHPSYETNPLVNVMCVGFVRADRIARARAAGPGNPVYLVGARTGRDGIHGAGLLASRTFRADEGGEQRPRVQVGDPFAEKLVIEACLEALQTGGVVGIQDLGAAGITAASSELAARAGTGIDLDLDRVPRREEGMTPFELLLSESQERMMLVVEAGREAEIERIFRRYRIEAARVGVVTQTGRLRAWQAGRLVADVPAGCLAGGAPLHPAPPPRPLALPSGRAARQDALPARPLPGALAGGPSRQPAAPPDPRWVAVSLRKRLASPAGCSRAWVYEQFDHTVGVRTVLPPGHDAAVLRVLPGEPVPGASGRSPLAAMVALSIDGAEWLAEGPAGAYAAGMEAVLEGARNVAAAGARPIGITNGLNLGNPERPEVMQQIADVVAGIGDACVALRIPVTGGNVSLYNETLGNGRSRAILPTPIVGMVGLVECPRPVPSAFQQPGDAIVLIGEPALMLSPGEWQPDLEGERLAIEGVLAAARSGLLHSCHDLGQGGIVEALAEAALLALDAPGTGAGGFDVRLPALSRDPERLLFGRGGPAWIATAALDDVDRLTERAGVPARAIGTVANGRMRLAIEGQGLALDEPTESLRLPWRGALQEAARP